jgi:hypothetical protein
MWLGASSISFMINILIFLSTSFYSERFGERGPYTRNLSPIMESEFIEFQLFCVFNLSLEPFPIYSVNFAQKKGKSKSGFD